MAKYRKPHAAFSKPKEEDFAFLNKTPENPLEAYTFDTLPQTLKAAYERAGWASIMPVQAHAMPYIVAGRDMMIQSRTGSGKTGAYLLPLLEKTDPQLKRTQALILVPTRELALQVEREAQNLFGDTLRTVTLYGGVPYNKQLDALRRGTQIIIGTPGRILDHLEKGTLNLESLQALVFDEADRMLSIGFFPDMKAIYDYLPNHPILACLFSATYPHHVLELAKQFLKNPELLSLSGGQVHIAQSEHYCVNCKPMEKDRVLINLLETENPVSAIIFCNTKATVHYVAQVLQGFGHNAEELSSELSQSKREYVLTRLRKGLTRFLVATDVAARGIDIPMLSHVFLYEPPEDRESYIHRAGRTGRAGAAGTVISLTHSLERLELQRIADFYKIDLIPLNPPTNEEVENAVGMRLITMLEHQKRSLTGLQSERILRYRSLAQNMAGLGEEKDEENLLLLAMLLDEKYQQSLAAPEAVLPTRARGSRQGFNRGDREKEESIVSPDDTLDSLQAAFHKEKEEKERFRRKGRNAPFKPRSREDRFDAPQFGDRQKRSEPVKHEEVSSKVRISYGNSSEENLYSESGPKRRKSLSEGHSELKEQNFREERESASSSERRPFYREEREGRSDRQRPARDFGGRERSSAFPKRERSSEFAPRDSESSYPRRERSSDFGRGRSFDAPRRERSSEEPRSGRDSEFPRRERSFDGPRSERSGERSFGGPRRERSGERSFEAPRGRGLETPGRSRDSEFPRRERSSEFAPRDNGSAFPKRERSSGFPKKDRSSDFPRRERSADTAGKAKTFPKTKYDEHFDFFDEIPKKAGKRTRKPKE